MGALTGKSLFLNAFVKVLAAGLAFFANAWLVRWLGPRAYGEYTIFVTSCALIGVVARSGLDVNMVRLAALGQSRGDRDGLAVLQWKATGSALAMSSLAVAAYLLWWQTWGSRAGAEPIASLPMIGCGVLATTLTAVYGGSARGLGRIVAVDVQDAVLKPVLIMAGAWFASVVLGRSTSDAGRFAFVAANGLIALALLRLFVAALPRTAGVVPSAGDRSETRLFPPPRALHFVLIGGLSFALFQLDTLVLARYRPPADVGAYNMACNFARLVIFLPMILAGQAQPRLAVAWNANQPKAFFAALGFTLRAGIASACLASLALMLAGEILLRAISPDLARASAALIALSLGHVFNSVVILLSAGLLMARMETAVLRAQLAGAAVAVALYFLLIPTYGALGAAVAASAGMAIMCAQMLRATLAVRAEALG